MKKKLSITIMIIVLLFGTLISVSAYSKWKGSESFDNSLDNIQYSKDNVGKIKIKIDNLSTGHKQEIEYLENQYNTLVESYNHNFQLLIDRDKSILELQEDVLTRDKIIESLRIEVESLEQAHLDMLEIEKETKDLRELVKSLID